MVIARHRAPPGRPAPEQGGPGRRGQLHGDVDLRRGRTLQERRRRRGRGSGSVPWADRMVPDAGGHGAGAHLVDAEQLEGDARADHVDDGVDGRRPRGGGRRRGARRGGRPSAWARARKVATARSPHARAGRCARRGRRCRRPSGDVGVVVHLDHGAGWPPMPAAQHRFGAQVQPGTARPPQHGAHLVDVGAGVDAATPSAMSPAMPEKRGTRRSARSCPTPHAWTARRSMVPRRRRTAQAAP